jgi:Serine carboxypeptidase S28
MEINNNVFNAFYGGKKPNAKNIYSTHGQFDPWRLLGVQEDINESSPTVILPREFNFQINQRPFYN